MTSSLVGSARPITVTDTATYVLELGQPSDDQFGLTLISPDPSATTVWVSSDSGVQSRTGVPLPPGGSINWRNPGAVYAVVDAGAPPVEILLTSAVDSWQLPPSQSPETDQWVYNGSVLVPSSNDPATVLNLLDVTPGSLAWGSVLVACSALITGGSGVVRQIDFVITQPALGVSQVIGSVSAASNGDGPAMTTNTQAIAKSPYLITAVIKPPGLGGRASLQCVLTAALVPT